MTLSEACSLMQQSLNDCAYEMGSTSYQDHCKAIRVSPDYSGDKIIVEIDMYVVDPAYKEEVMENVASIIRSANSMHHIPYTTRYTVNFEYKRW